MIVAEIAAQLHLSPLALVNDQREVKGVYTGDLLSWVMGRAKPDQALVTIMTNVNVVAVASLLDLAMVVVCDNAMPDESVIETARAKDVNLFGFSGTAYDLCSALSRLGL